MAKKFTAKDLVKNPIGVIANATIKPFADNAKKRREAAKAKRDAAAAKKKAARAALRSANKKERKNNTFLGIPMTRTLKGGEKKIFDIK